MSLKECLFQIETDADGDYDVTLDSFIPGELYAVKLAVGDIDGGCTLTLSCNRAPDAVSVDLLTLTHPAADAIYYPREQVCGATGTALTLDGTEIAYGAPLVIGPLRCVVSAGGDTTSGTLLVYVED